MFPPPVTRRYGGGQSGEKDQHAGQEQLPCAALPARTPSRTSRPRPGNKAEDPGRHLTRRSRASGRPGPDSAEGSLPLSAEDHMPNTERYSVQGVP